MADFTLVVMALSSTYWPVLSFVLVAAQPSVANSTAVATRAVRVLIVFMGFSGKFAGTQEGLGAPSAAAECRSGGCSQCGESDRTRQFRRCGSELMACYRWRAGVIAQRFGTAGWRAEC